MSFKFPLRRKKKADLEVPSLFDLEAEAQEDEEQPGVINGQQARSILEWRVAKALWSMGLTFFYQYPLFGGTQIRGGFVVDFIVDTAPQPIPLEVQGERWHTNNFAADEMRRKAMIESALGTELKYVWENELQSQEDANVAVRKVLQ